MISAIFGQIKITVLEKTFEKSLPVYHTIPTLNDTGEEAFRKYYGKRRKCWLPAFSPFPTMFSTRLKTNFIIRHYLNWHLQILSIMKKIYILSSDI